MFEMPVIDAQKCNGCGFCVNVCNCGAIVMVNNIATIVEKKECQWCTYCEAVCPTGAISCPFQVVFEKA